MCLDLDVRSFRLNRTNCSLNALRLLLLTIVKFYYFATHFCNVLHFLQQDFCALILNKHGGSMLNDPGKLFYFCRTAATFKRILNKKYLFNVKTTLMD